LDSSTKKSSSKIRKKRKIPWFAWPSTYTSSSQPPDKRWYSDEDISEPGVGLKSQSCSDSSVWQLFFDLPVRNASMTEDMSLEQERLLDWGKYTDPVALRLGQGAYKDRPVAVLVDRTFSKMRAGSAERKCRNPLTASGLYWELMKPVCEHTLITLL
jgi:hypothetical protein